LSAASPPLPEQIFFFIKLAIFWTITKY
jgi:hypothetical protein